MLLKIIAIFFLGLFLIKLLSPNVFPLIRSFFKKLFNYFEDFIKIIWNGLFRAVTLLFTKTVYVVGVIILSTLLIATVYTTIKYPNITDIKSWFKEFKGYLLNIYVYTFFSGVFILGVIDYLKDRMTITAKITSYINSQLRKKSQKQYVYDEETKKYIYK